MKIKPAIKTLKSLQRADVILTEPPKLENEPPHQRLARATREHARITEELRKLKKDWADRNIKAQACRQTVSTPEVTHFETLKRELAMHLLALQAEIGTTNKEIRSRKGPPQQKSAKNGSQPHKEHPLREHREFNAYFRLAAETELEPRLYAQVEKIAKAMLTDALRNGTEDP
jgi:hypothetical protein